MREKQSNGTNTERVKGMETRREFAKRVAKEISWSDVFKDPKDVSIETFWRLFSQIAFEGKGISALQYGEMKKAYFIGFSDCFKFMSDFANEMSEDKACEIFSKIAKESNEYIDSLLDRTLK